MENYSLKINLDLLDQNRAFQGKKGRYLELVMIATPNGQYGTHMVKQSLSKEERQSGKQMPILGNASPLGFRQQKKPDMDSEYQGLKHEDAGDRYADNPPPF